MSARSSGFERLDQSAIDEAKRSWRLVPATKAGVPFAQWYKVRVTFKLTSSDKIAFTLFKLQWVIIHMIVPIYLHGRGNAASARVAEAAGFPDQGWFILGLPTAT